MIDMATETLISLSEAARSLPSGRNNKGTHPSTIFRWIVNGVKTPTGKLHLDAIKLGGRWLTSREAMQRFAEQQTPEFTAPVQMPRSPAARRRASERAAAELERLGVR